MEILEVVCIHQSLSFVFELNVCFWFFLLVLANLMALNMNAHTTPGSVASSASAQWRSPTPHLADINIGNLFAAGPAAAAAPPNHLSAAASSMAASSLAVATGSSQNLLTTAPQPDCKQTHPLLRIYLFIF